MTEIRTLSIKVGTDLVCIIILGLPVLGLYLFGEPFKRGFNCDDESLRYPYKDSTVTNVVLYTLGIGIPTLTIVIVEFVRFKRANGAVNRDNLFRLLLTIYNELVIFVFGALSSQLLTDIAKYTIGRLRPHFIDVCRPKNLNTLCGPEGWSYVEDFECTQTNKRLLKEMRLSFMSGHSSFSAYCMVYFAIYLQRRATWSSLGLIRPLLQVTAVYLSFATGFSRISDYKHHWSDVMIGLIQGTAIAILTHWVIRKCVANFYLSRSRTIVRSQSPSTHSPAPTPTVGSNYKTCAIEMRDD